MDVVEGFGRGEWGLEWNASSGSFQGRGGVKVFVVDAVVCWVLGSDRGIG